MFRYIITVLFVAVLTISPETRAQTPNITVDIGFQNGFTDGTAEGLRINGLYAPGETDVKGREKVMGLGIVTADDNCHDLDDGSRYCSDSNAIQLYYGYRWSRPITRDRVLMYELQGNLFTAIAWWDYDLDTKEVGIAAGAQGRAALLFDMGIPVTFGVGLDVGIGIALFKEAGIEFYMPLGGQIMVRYDLE